MIDPQRFSVILPLMLWPAEPVLCALALFRRVWRVLPCFVIYLVVLVVVDATRWIVEYSSGLNSLAYSWTYWMSQPLQILARSAVLVDICRAALRPYSGLWRLAKPLLMVTATVLMAFAAVRTNESNRMVSYILFVQRELEFAIVLSLLALLLLSRYYGVVLDQPLSGIALGMGFLSSYVILAFTVMLEEPQIPQWAFSIANTLAFTTALGIWIRALWAPLPLPVQPELSTVESYEQNTLAVSEQMREVTDRLSQLSKR